MSFTNWLDFITCLFVLYRISTNSHLCTTNYSIFHQFLIVSPDRSTSARSSTIVIFDLWNPHNEYFHAVKYLSCSGMRSYKKYFLILIDRLMRLHIDLECFLYWTIALCKMCFFLTMTAYLQKFRRYIS